MATKAKTQAKASPNDQKRRDKLEKVIAKGLAEFRAVGQALIEIRDGKLYKLAKPSYKTFESYCAGKWGFTGRRGRQLVEATKFCAVIETAAVEAGEKAEQFVPETEGETRDLHEQIKELVPDLASKASEDFDANDRLRLRQAVQTANRASAEQDLREETEQELTLKLGGHINKAAKLAGRMEDTNKGDAVKTCLEKAWMILFNEVLPMARAA